MIGGRPSLQRRARLSVEAVNRAKRDILYLLMPLVKNKVQHHQLPLLLVYRRNGGNQLEAHGSGPVLVRVQSRRFE
jgi:hypothetical protein